MTIRLDPNRVRASSAGAGKSERKNDENFVIPPRPAKAHVNHMPSPESLRTLIASAVAALAKGIRWDRGTILNLLV